MTKKLQKNNEFSELEKLKILKKKNFEKRSTFLAKTLLFLKIKNMEMSESEKLLEKHSNFFLVISDFFRKKRKFSKLKIC